MSPALAISDINTRDASTAARFFTVHVIASRDRRRTALPSACSHHRQTVPPALPYATLTSVRCIDAAAER